MDVEAARKILAWCTIFNWILLFIWWGFVAFAGDWVYRTHGMWFKQLSRETFDTIHYSGMMALKTLVFFACLVPYLVLRIFF